MIYDYLKPVSNKAIEKLLLYTDVRFGTSISIHTDEFIPEINKETAIAIIGVHEDRDSVNNQGTGNDFSSIRAELYDLYFGNWHLNIVDLGNM
ncbi:MAG TPA: hypothetical protein EYP87_05890 [Flavobacteriaceae bacterium]|nr:hypothetical protein [Flavobacteriaceae bacterium]